MRGRLFRDVCRAVQSWWNCDRIRVSPREGSLLRTQPGDLLLLTGTPLEVLSREIHEGPRGYDLRLTCREGSDIGSLQICVTWDGNVEFIHWNDPDTCRYIVPDDLEVWTSRRMV